ncbi:rhodanese-like domain-containing protein [Nesterenkonia ebinurensis]|uniref:rhodanese-like domain-containing protein n=1 Tax=Nesterenkonia ebinurensis TaxID=2608252 RepID=UPI00123CFC06|nr:rhodanese-like domain-containing protein [Nesterenkonia ebinurensis]
MMTAEEFFLASLAFKTDPSDLGEARMRGEGPVVVDVRNQAAWDQGHIPGALHIPRAEMPDRLPALIPEQSTEIVLYCWGPGCNGSTKAALDLTRVGYTSVKELLGGYEYWAREGLAIETAKGRTRRPVDELTAPVS